MDKKEMRTISSSTAKLADLSYGFNHNTKRPNISYKGDGRLNQELHVTVEVTAELVAPDYEPGENIPTLLGDIPYTPEEIQDLAEYARGLQLQIDENAALVYALINKYVMPEINEFCDHRFAEPLPGTVSQFRGYTIHTISPTHVQRIIPEL